MNRSVQRKDEIKRSLLSVLFVAMSALMMAYAVLPTCLYLIDAELIELSENARETDTEKENEKEKENYESDDFYHLLAYGGLMLQHTKDYSLFSSSWPAPPIEVSTPPPEVC